MIIYFHQLSSAHNISNTATFETTNKQPSPPHTHNNRQNRLLLKTSSYLSIGQTVSRERRSVSRSYVLLKRWMFQNLRNSGNPLKIALHTVKAITAKVEAQTWITLVNLNKVEKIKKTFRKLVSLSWMHWF